MAEKQFNIKLKATDKLSGPLKKAGQAAKTVTTDFKRLQAEIRKTSTSTINLGKSLQRIGGQMQSIGRKMTMYFTLPVVAGITASLKKFSDFEEGLVGVEDTTGLTGDGLKNLAMQIRALAKITPTGTEELLALAEVAGKAGATTPNDVMAIVDTMNRLTAISKLAGEETTLALTRILSFSKEPTSNIKKMGAALANLGDIIDEGRIIESADAIGRSLVGMYNIGSGNILALGTTFAKMNIPVKASGTMIKKSMDVINDAISKGKGGAQLQKITGLNKKELKTLFAKDQFAVFEKFLGGLSDMAKSGKDIKPTLKSMGLLDSGIAKLVDQYDLLHNSVETTKQQYQDENALIDESNKKWATTAARLAILKNKFTDIGITIGEKLAPYLSEKLIPALEKMISWMDKHPKITKFAAAAALVVAALGPLLTILGTVVSMLGTVLANWAILKAAFIASKIWIGASIGLIGAWAIAIAGVGALAYVIIRRWKTAKLFFMALWDGPIGALIRWTNPLYLLYRLGKLIVDNWQSVKNFFVMLWDSPIGKLLKYTNPLYWLIRLAALIPINWKKVGTFFADLWTGAKRLFMEFYDYIIAKTEGLGEKIGKALLPGFFGDDGSFNKNLTEKGRKALEKINGSTQGTGGNTPKQTSFKWPTMGAAVQPMTLVTKETVKTKTNDAKVTVDFKNVPKGTEIKAKKYWWLNINQGQATA